MKKTLSILFTAALAVGLTLTMTLPVYALTGGWSDNFDSGAQQTWSFVDGGDNSTHLFQNDRYELHTESVPGGSEKYVASYVDWNYSDCVMQGRVQTIDSGDVFLTYLLARGTLALGNGYVLGASASGAHLWFGKLEGGAYSNLAAVAPPAYNPADFKFRFGVFGTTLVGKVWSTGAAEPTEWQITHTDASYASGVGGVMLATYPALNWDVVQAAFDDVSLMPLSQEEVWVDDGWTGTAANTEVELGKIFGYNAFATIQDGIAAVDPGGTVYVAAGTYEEAGQIVINKNLTIIGAGKTTTIIKPNQNIENWVVVQAGVQFHLSEVTLDGQGHSIRAAIRTHGSGSISNTIIKNIRHSQYLGWGIALTWSTTGQDWTISANEFRNIERVGILVDGAGNVARVSDNTFVGNGDGDWVGYGVEVGDGAYAEISGNTIYGYRGVASSDGSKSGAILVTSYFGPNPEALIVGNNLRNNTTAIYVGYSAGDTSKVVANFNNVFANDEYGVSAIATLTTPVDATHNWWGHASGPSGEGPGSGDSVSVNVDFDKWLGAKMTDQTAGCTADRDTGETASPSTDNASAAATGGSTSTVVYVAEFVGNPTGVNPGFASGALFFDVFVSGSTPSELVVVANCPGGNCAGMMLKWFDFTESKWRDVTPVSVVGGTVVATLSDTSVPTVEQLKGQPFGLGNPHTVGWEGSPVNKLAVLAPWIALFAVMMAGGGLLVLRRRQARI